MYFAQRVSVSLLFTLVLTIVSGTCAYGNEYRPSLSPGERIYAGNGYVEMIGPMVFMHLKGNSYEIGRQHGTLLTHILPEEVATEMRNRFDPLAAEVAGVDRLIQGFQRFYFQYKLAPWIQRNVPTPFLEEMKGITFGISGGTDTDPLDVLVANASQDLGMTYGCTSIVAFGEATASGKLYHARNLDHIFMIDVAQYGYVVVIEPDEGYPFITHMYPIHVGNMQAMNNQGITVSVNYSLVQRQENDLDGMPLVLLMRKIVQYAASLDEAIAIVLNTPRTFGVNIVISDSKGPDAVVIEADANRYAIRSANNGFVYSANRYNDSYMQPFQAPGWLASERRENRLSTFAAENHGHMTLESLIDLLRDRNEPGSTGYENLVDGINNAGTLLSAVFSPVEQMMWIALLDNERGAPDTDFYAFSLERALAGQHPAVPDRNILGPEPTENLGNWLLLRRAKIAYAQNRLPAVLDYLDRLDPAYTDVEAVWNLKAHTHLRMGSRDTAEAYFQSLALFDEVTEPFHHLEAFAILGTFFDSRDDRNKALEYYQKSLDLDIPDLGGNTSFYRQLASIGLQRPVYLITSPSGYSFTTGEHPVVRWLRAPVPPVAECNDWDRYEGREIAEVRVLGNGMTNGQTLQGVMGLLAGQAFSAADASRAHRRLEGLDAFDDVEIYVIPVQNNKVDVVVRINEGFGWYLDPLKAVIDTIIGLSNRTISLRYYNIGGSLVSMGGQYGFGSSQEREIHATLPIFSQPTRIGYHSQTTTTEIAWGEHSGSSYTANRQILSASSYAPLTEKSSLRLALGYARQHVAELDTDSELHVSSSPQLTLAGAWEVCWPGGTAWTKQGTSIQIGAGIIASRGTELEYLPRLSLQASHQQYLGAGFVANLEGRVAWTHANTPFDRRFTLGGNGELGARNSMFFGSMYMYSRFELQRYFTPNLSFFTGLEFAHIWEEVSQKGTSLYGFGGGLAFATPIGMQIRAQYSTNLTLTDIHSFRIGISQTF